MDGFDTSSHWESELPPTKADDNPLSQNYGSYGSLSEIETSKKQGGGAVAAIIASEENPSSPLESSRPEENVVTNENNENDTNNQSRPSAMKQKLSSSPIPSSLSNDHGISITVGNPTKNGESVKDSYTTYEVTTRYTSSSGHVTIFKVRRRYQEFLWIESKLAADYPACIIPPLPEKHRTAYLDRFSQEFVDRRMTSLERFLHRVAAHPVLHKSEDFKVFLEKEFLATESIGGRRESFMDNISDAVINAFSKIQRPDERFINFNFQIAKLETHCKNLHKSQQAVFKHLMDLFEDGLDLVPSFSNIAHLEKDIFDLFMKLAEVQQKSHTITKETLDIMESQVHGIIKEYIQYSRSAKFTLKSRDQKQIELEDLNQYLKDAIAERDKIKRTGDPHAGKSNPITHFITQKMDELKGVDPERAKSDRLSKLENRIAELQKGVTNSGEIAQQFNDRLVSEFEFMTGLKEQELKIYIKRYSERQIEYHEKVQKTPR